MQQKPAPLQPGDQVAIVSLSRGILGETATRHQRQLGIQRLEALGLKPVFMPHALKGVDYLAQHPEARAADLKMAFYEPKIRGIFAAIGGDDTYRTLPYLLTDQQFKLAVRHDPKLFSGFSDTTINHLMFYQLGLQTFYGPNFLNDLAELASQPLPYTWQTLQHYKQNPARTVIESSTIWYEERTDFSRQAIGTPRPQHQEQRGYEVLRGSGITTGRLLGGCLDSFYDILTTTRYPDEAQVCAKYQLFPNTATWQDKILFIETSETHPQPRLYQKMLEKLADQGVFAAIRGIIVGKPQNEIFYEAYKQILLTVTAPYQMPIFYNVNFGHGYPRTALPYGALLQMDCDQKTLTIMEPFFANA